MLLIKATDGGTLLSLELTGELFVTPAQARKFLKAIKESVLGDRILFSVGGGKLEPLVSNGFAVDRRDHREKCKSISIYKEKT